MSTDTEVEEPAQAPGRPRVRRARQVLAVVLLVGWVAVLWTTVLTGSRAASWEALSGALESGRLDSVTVVGEELPDTADGSGYALVEVRWRDGGLVRRTAVRQVVGGEDPPRTGGHVVRGSVTAALRELDAGVRVRHEPLRGGGEITVVGLRLEGPSAAATFGLALATLMLLLGGPEPERATRWAWFWLFTAAPPLACPAYLLLGGMVRTHPQPGPRRLRGGWAFVLALLLGGASAAG